MSSLKARLSKAKSRLFGTATKDIAVPFELRCECGHNVAGVRRLSYQIATCSVCDARIYVLPVNVYPATQRIQSEVLDGSVASRLSVILRDLASGECQSDSDSSPNSVAPPGRPRRLRAASEESESNRDSSRIVAGSPGRSRKTKSVPKISSAAAALVADQILVEEPVVRVPRPGITVVLRRIFTPFRLLMLSAAVLIGVTGWWIVTQRQMDDARKTWRREMDVAEQALTARDLVTLHDSLSKAVTAATTLRRDDPDSRLAVSLLLQTQAVQDLSSTDLISTLAGCVSDGGKLSTEKIAVAADSLNGNWFAFECSLRHSPAGLTADFPLILNSVPVTISISSELLQRAGTALPQSPLMFVASVESCSVLDGGKELHVQLNGKSSTLITTRFHATQLGFTGANSQSLDALLARQAEFVKSNETSRGKDRSR